MAKIVAVHGVGNQFEREHSLKAEWLPYLKDGLARIGRTLGGDKALTCAF